MNCTEMIPKISDYPYNHPLKIEVMRECYDDSLTIILTILFLIVSYLSSFIN